MRRRRLRSLHAINAIAMPSAQASDDSENIEPTDRNGAVTRSSTSRNLDQAASNPRSS